MRSFEFARKIVDGVVTEDKQYESAEYPVYSTKASAGADFFCAEEVVVPSIWKSVIKIIVSKLTSIDFNFDVSPTIVHTGIKSNMADDEVLELYNRSSNPKKLGLVLANSVGVIDADYYNNPDNDGEIMFAFYNFKPFDVTLKVGDRIGQGVFKKFLRPEINCIINDAERKGGFGSTGTAK